MSQEAYRPEPGDPGRVVPVPADVNRADPVLAGLSFRQLAVLAGVGGVLYAGYAATRSVLPPQAAAVVGTVVGGLAVAVVVLRRDGIGVDRLAAAAVRCLTGPRRLVPSPGRPVPAWAGLPATAARPVPGRLRLPARGLAADGVLDLGPDGAAMVCAASTVNLGLRTPAEQDGLVAGYAGWLNSLTGPVQILVRADRVDPSPLVWEVEDRAAELPDPGLEAAALGHAGFLRQLAAERDLLRRQVLVVLREPVPAGARGRAGRAAARARVVQRAEQTAAALAGVGVRVSVLDGPAAAAVLTVAADPARPAPPPGLAPPGAPVTGPGGDRAGAPSARTGGGEGLLGVAAAGVQVQPRRLRVGAGWAATLAVVGYPAQVGPGWPEPLTAWPGRLDVAFHVDPVPAPVAAARLRRQLARLESTRRSTAEKGRLADPAVDAAAADAEGLAAGLARGQGRLFSAGLYLTVHAESEQELDAEVAAVRGVAASLLLDCVPVSWRALQGWITTLPVGVDLLRLHRTLDTAALAAGFPFTAPDLPAADPATPGAPPTGILYGLNTATGGLVVWDRWACDNHNTLILARSGAGKSYLAKLDLLRSLHHGVHAHVVDPEDEYRRLAGQVGGAVVRLGAPGVRLNPLDLAGDRRADALTRRALFLHTVVAVLLAELVDSAGRAALDRAITTAYTGRGITADPRTWRRRPPLLADVTAALAADADPAGPGLAGRLAPYTGGSWAGLFDGPTTTRPTGHLVVWSLRDLPDELKPAGTLLALDRIWTGVASGERRRRLVLVDEAWTLMRDPHGARFLYRMAKAARKHWAGLTVVTQDPADLLSTDLGQAVAANSATQILLRHAPQAAPAVAAAFDLTAGERAWLTSAPRGHGLLLGGGSGERVAFEALASTEEHALITTDPAELAAHPDRPGDELVDWPDVGDGDQRAGDDTWPDDPDDGDDRGSQPWSDPDPDPDADAE